MQTIKRIQNLLNDLTKVPIYDQSGKIISPIGVETSIEARGVKKCLKIALEEYNNESIRRD